MHWAFVWTGVKGCISATAKGNGNSTEGASLPPLVSEVRAHNGRAPLRTGVVGVAAMRQWRLVGLLSATLNERPPRGFDAVEL